MRLSNTDRQAKIDIIEKWMESGLSQKDFYQQQNIPAHVFYYWHKCYRDKLNKKTSSSSGGFIQLTSPVSQGSIDIHFPNGTRITFNHTVSADFVKALIG